MIGTERAPADTTSAAAESGSRGGRVGGVDPARVPWAIRVVVEASEEQARAAVTAIARALCPDEEHAGPCPLPWTLMMCDLEELDEAERASWREEFAADRAAYAQAHREQPTDGP